MNLLHPLHGACRSREWSRADKRWEILVHIHPLQSRRDSTAKQTRFSVRVWRWCSVDTIMRVIGHMEGESRQVLVFEDQVLDVYSTLPRGVSESSVLYLVSLSDIQQNPFVWRHNLSRVVVPGFNLQIQPLTGNLFYVTVPGKCHMETIKFMTQMMEGYDRARQALLSNDTILHD